MFRFLLECWQQHLEGCRQLGASLAMSRGLNWEWALFTFHIHSVMGWTKKDKNVLKAIKLEKTRLVSSLRIRKLLLSSTILVFCSHLKNHHKFFSFCWKGFFRLSCFVSFSFGKFIFASNQKTKTKTKNKIKPSTWRSRCFLLFYEFCFECGACMCVSVCVRVCCSVCE